MINVSNEFFKQIEYDTKFNENAEITFSDGRVITLTDSDFTMGNNSLVDGSGANSLPLGVAVCKTIQIEIANYENQYQDYDFLDAKIRLYITYQLSNSIETINLGRYTVNTPETYGKTIIINAFDDMYKADKPYTSNIAFPTTAALMLADACENCGLLYNAISFRNSDFVITGLPSNMQSGSVTYRDIIGYLAMIAVGNARINYNGYLEIVEYDFEIKKDDIKQKFDKWIGQPKLSVEDIIITGVQIEYQEDNKTKTVLEGTEGYVISVENPLVSGKEEYFLSLLAKVLISASFRQFEGDYIAYPIGEFMDPIVIIDGDSNEHISFLTDINFVFYGITTLKNSAESPIRNSSKYNSAATQAYVRALQRVDEERTAREEAIQNLGNLIGEASGMYSTNVEQSNGSVITYWHDKPKLEESKNVIIVTSNAIGFSTDGGNTYPNGITIDGKTITRLLYAEGINADYINTGAIVVKDSSGKVIFSVDITTGTVLINGSYIMIGDKTLTQALDESTSLIVSISNEYQGIPTDSNGNYDNMPTVKTIVTAYYGHRDVSSECSYSISTTSGITGSWNAQTRTYIVESLTEDTASVDITVTYLNTLVSTKRFTVAKVKAGAQGEKGDTGAPGRTYFLQPSSTVMKIGADGVFAPKSVTFASFYRDGSSATRTAYPCRFVIAVSVDGTLYSNVYTSSSDETSFTYTPASTSIVSIRCRMYAAGGLTTLLDTQSVSVLIDIDNLSQEQVFNILTNNGETQGLYYLDGKIYLNASFIKTGTLSADLIKGGTLQIGGTSNTYGKIEIYDSSNVLAFDITQEMLRFYEQQSANSIYYMYLSKDGLKLKRRTGIVDYYLSNGIEIDYSSGNIDADFREVVATNVCVSSTATVTSGTTAVFDSDKYLRKLASSSKRYKEIERVLTDEDVRNAYNIEVYLAKYKDDYLSESDERYQKLMPMFTVENIEQYLPIAVNHNEDGSPEMWNLQIMIAVMFQMIKGQKKEIDILKKSLETRNLTN